MAHDPGCLCDAPTRQTLALAHAITLTLDRKILPLGQGKHETAMLQTLIDSGYSGPIGILDHRNDTDSKIALKANLDGLKILENQLKLK